MKKWFLAALLFFVATCAQAVTSTNGYVQNTLAFSSSVALSNPTQSESLLFCALVAGSTSTTLSVTDTLTNSWVQVGTNHVVGSNTFGLFVVYKNYIYGGSDTVTGHTTAGTVSEMQCAEYVNQNFPSVIDTATFNSGSSTTVSFGPMSSTGTYETFLAIGFEANGTAPSPSAGFTNHPTVNNTYSFVVDGIFPSAGSQSVSWTTTSVAWEGFFVAFKPMPLTQVAADNFTRANENPLSDGGNWSTISGVNALQLYSDVATYATSPTGAAIWTGNTFTNDQYVDVVFSSAAIGNTYSWWAVRENTSSSAVYYTQLVGAGYGNSGTYHIYKTGGTSLGTYAMTINSGDVLRLQVTGYCVMVWQNGNFMGAATDAAGSVASGAPALYVYAGATTQGFSSFDAGDASPAYVSVPGGVGVFLVGP
jgi:hypothetical protein